MTILDALRSVAAQDPDNARDRNDVGFSGLDTVFACKLAAQESLTAKQEVYAARFVRKYRKQVYAYANRTCTLKGKKLDAVIEAFLTSLTWQHPTFDFNYVPPVTKSGKVSVQVGKDTGMVKAVVISFKYSAELVAAVKTLPKRRFDSAAKNWVVDAPTASDLAAVRNLAHSAGFDVSPAVSKYLGA